MNKRDFTKNRSDSYQFVINESPCPPEILTEFADALSIGGRLNDPHYNEELYDLKDQLRIEFWRVIDTQLTKRQREVLRLYADGYTQIEIAKMLKVNQSSVTKSINGNCDYRNKTKKVYGGSRKKLKRIISKDDRIQELLKRIAEIQEETW